MIRRRSVAVVGAGLAGCCSALSAQEAGGDVQLIERASMPGGATLDAAGWIWRYRDIASAACFAPRGSSAVQGAIVERLDDDLAWLARRGVRLPRVDTERRFTSGARIDPAQAIDALVARLDPGVLRCGVELVGATHCAAGSMELLLQATDGQPGQSVERVEVDGLICCGGGYVSDLDRVARLAGAPARTSARWELRTRGGGDGSVLDVAATLGAPIELRGGESLVRPVPVGGAELSARDLHVWGELAGGDRSLHRLDGSLMEPRGRDWSGSQAMWDLARTDGAGWLGVDREALDRVLSSGNMRDVVIEELLGGRVRLAISCGFTTTLGGIVVDGHGRAATGPASVFGAGVDAFGAGSGGIASGLAQALVLGRSAGRAAAAGDW